MSVDPVERWNLALCATAFGLAWALASPRFAWSLAVGAALEAVNFRGLRRAGELFFAGRLPGGWTAGYGVRFGLLTIGVAVAIYAGAHPLGLLLGLSMIVPAVVIWAWRSRPPVLPDAPTLGPDDPEWKRWNPWLARERDEDDDEDEW